MKTQSDIPRNTSTTQRTPRKHWLPSRILPLFLILLLAGSIARAESLGLQIGNWPVTTDNYQNIGDLAPVKSGTVTLDPDSKVLTLENALISIDASSNAHDLEFLTEYTLVLKGNNSLKIYNLAEPAAIYAKKNLTIEGSGSLECNAKILAAQNLTIKSCRLSSFTFYPNIDCRGDLTVDGAYLVLEWNGNNPPVRWKRLSVNGKLSYKCTVVKPEGGHISGGDVWTKDNNLEKEYIELAPRFCVNGFYFERIGTEEKARLIPPSKTEPYWPASYETPTGEIPATVNIGGVQCQVVEIAAHALKKCSGLESVSIPSTVKTIGEGAFSGCQDLTTVQLQEGLETIGIAAFINCTKLTAITLPTSLKTLDQVAFTNTGIKTVEIPGDLNCRNAFKECKSLETVTILPGPKESIKTIEGDAFVNCTALKTVTLPDYTTTLGTGAFQGCTALENINLPPSLETIGIKAFNGCTQLQKLLIPKSITTIGQQAFNDCTALTFIEVEQEDPSAITLGPDIFKGMNKSQCTLRVPIGKAEDYKNAEQWQELNVEALIPVEGITIEPTSATMAKGEKLTLQAIITPSNASNQNITWKKSTTIAISLNPAGIVTALRPGTATITATTEDGGYQATCEITVGGGTDTPVTPPNKGQYRITPNPAHGLCRIEGLASPANVEVYNAIGQKVLELETADAIDLTGLPAGEYLARIKNESLRFIVE
ncbi:MAG: hypothetical protein CSA97_06070 [Bacteroidetes bacterium]|nr:MAG: hypothetical protein CSA97_06070 [Bacteroidota bacterium]